MKADQILALFTREQIEEEILFDVIYQLMTVEERQQLFLLNCNGLWDQRTNTVMMDNKAMDEYLEFKHQMIKKYGSTSN